MKKLLLVLLGVALLSFGKSIIAQDLDDILKNYFETAGQDKLLQVNTITMDANIMVQGMELPFKLVLKRPKMLRIETTIQGQKIIRVFDGENGWMINPMMGTLEPQDMDTEMVKQLRSQADMDGELYNYEEKGHTVEYLGTDEMEGTEVHKIKLTRKDGDETIFYIDADAYVILKATGKRKIQGVEVESESTFSNYKMVEGIVFPFSITSGVAGQQGAQIVIDTVLLDKPVADSLFVKPEK
jgi:outer membrane lipoprotein-sorting protein